MVREIDVADLHDLVRIPFVTHQVDPLRTERAWVHGAAVAVDTVRSRPGEVRGGPGYTCLGPQEDLEVLVEHLARTAPRPWRVAVEQPAALPEAWPLAERSEWHWMLTGTPPPDDRSWQVDRLDQVRDAVEIDELLDASNADSFARPGVPGVEVWMGIRERSPHASRLLAAGALQRMHDGTLHVRGVGVLPETRGAGAGTALSTALTRHALVHGSGRATLAVYVDNHAAIRVYTRLGYRVRHTFTSGLLAP
jgi:ribosomal protein S18 acetylase RimI-like enzyme